MLPEAAIYVVNNNSRDRTRERALQALRSLGNSGAVLDEPRQGKGNALRRAFHDIDADVYLLADADSTYPADRARDLISPILEGRADMVVGDRQSGGHYARENRRPFHHSATAWCKRWSTGCSGRPGRHHEWLPGIRPDFIKSYPILVEGFPITDMTLHSLYRRFRILELPIQYKDRPAGSESKLNTFADGARVLFAITQILRFYRPLLFFSGLASLLAVSGLLAGVPVLNDWLTTGYIAHVPLAILASALEIVAMLMLSVGLILDSVAYHERMEYERHALNDSCKPPVVPNIVSNDGT